MALVDMNIFDIPFKNAIINIKNVELDNIYMKNSQFLFDSSFGPKVGN